MNPDQIQALLSMSSPKNIHEMQQLIERVMTPNRFILKLVGKCLSFFKILRKNKAFEWTYKSEMVFQQLKVYLELPPFLIVSNLGSKLILYLYVLPIAVSTILVKEEDKIQRPIYHVSKILRGAKTRYLKIEKLAYALTITTRKLCHYFQAHPIIVFTDQTLKQILQ